MYDVTTRISTLLKETWKYVKYIGNRHSESQATDGFLLFNSKNKINRL